MAHAYTPGLTVTAMTTVHKMRRLPLKGTVLVKKGDRVTARDVVAKTHLPGPVELINLAHKLGLDPPEIKECLKKKDGDTVAKGDMIAESPGFFGFFKSRLDAPVAGTIESVSFVTGQMVLRQAPIPIEVKAYVDGEIDEVIADEGVVVRTDGTYIQGIFGIGGEVDGDVVLVTTDPARTLTPDVLNESHKGKIVVGGSRMSSESIQRAQKLGIAGIIAGGIDAKDLQDFLGFDLGVAITGHEDKGITLVVTEGFGEIAMAEKTFELLKAAQGKRASINGATQIRAGVIRPEVIIPLPRDPAAAKGPEGEAGHMDIGSAVRIIRVPHFGRIAKVVSLPPSQTRIPTEAHVRVVEVEFQGGERYTLPRANVELIEA